MPSFTIKTGDTFPNLKATLKDAENIPLDLSTATTIELHMKSGTHELKGACVKVEGGSTGKVEYVWKAGDSDTAGTYQLEFKVTWPTGKIQSVPNDTFDTVVIVQGV